MNSKVKIGLVLIVGVLAMSSAAIMIRVAQLENVPSITIAGYRLLIASVILSAPAIRQQVWKEYATLNRRAIILIVGSGLLLGLHFASWVTSLEETSVASSVVLVTTTPIWIALASPMLLGERSGVFTWVGIGLAFAGGMIIGFGNLNETTGLINLRGDALALLGALFAAGYLMIGRATRDTLTLTGYLWAVYGTAAIFLMGWALVSDASVMGFSTTALLALLGLGVIPQLIGHSAANYAMRYLPATLVALTSLGEPIGATVLAATLLGETPEFHQIIGGVLILGGIAITSVMEEQRKKRNQRLEGL